jgi:hypothetical protein
MYNINLPAYIENIDVKYCSPQIVNQNNWKFLKFKATFSAKQTFLKSNG